MSSTKTVSATYTTADVEKVFRRVQADLAMIADSTGGWTSEKTADYVHDVEELAKEGYLKHVDITLLSANREICAARFEVNAAASATTSERPGGVLWPRVNSPNLRIILTYESSYDESARAKMKPKLRINWTPTSVDTSHSQLSQAKGRNYASNGYGVDRTDWAA
jgi:hypothetical protein